MEQNKHVAKLLKLEGTTLTLVDADRNPLSQPIPCISQFSLTEIYNEDNNNVQEQKFVFFISETSAVIYELVEDMEVSFIPRNSIYKYIFSLTSFAPDMAGFYIITASFVERLYV